MNVNTDGLPPEMQARISEIIERAKSGAQQPGAATAAATAAAAPVQRIPSLMDHMIALRQENAQLVQMVQAQGQVLEAVGNAVGQLYQMFCTQTEVTDHGATYASQFQQQPVTDD